MRGAWPNSFSDRRRLGQSLGVLLAFLAGVAIAAALAARFGWFTHAPPTSAAPPVRTALTNSSPPPAPSSAIPLVDPTALSAREAILSAQLASIESRTAIVSADADEASNKASRAEAMLVAFAARRAVDRGLGLGTLEQPLHDCFDATQARAVALIVQAAHERVTLEDLRAGLDVLSTDLLSGGRGWWASLRHDLGALIVVHRAGTSSAVPADRLARVRRLVDAGQVEAALVEVERMPGATQATNWIGAARRYVEVHRALDTVESAAILGRTAPSATR